MNTIENTILDRVNVWLTPTFDTEIQDQIKNALLKISICGLTVSGLKRLYENLKGNQDSDYNYNYGLSSWIFLMAQPPSYGVGYSKFTNSIEFKDLYL